MLFLHHHHHPFITLFSALFLGSHVAIMVRYLSVYMHFSGLQIATPPDENIHPAAFQRKTGVTAMCLLSAAFAPVSFHFQGESESVSEHITQITW